MTKKWIAVGSIAAVAVLGLGVGAWAAGGSAAGEKGAGGLRGRGRVVYGELTSAGASSWTLRPQIPPKLQERLEARAAEKGIELPSLPESITVGVGSESNFWLNGQSAAAEDFKAGDEVVIRLDKSWKETGASIMGAADPQTARNYICASVDKMRADAQGRGDGGGGKGERHGKGGPGGPGGRRPHPAFGVITAVSSDSITIKPEMPDFIKEDMEKRQQERAARQAEKGKDGKGKEGKGRGQRELPSELTFKLSDMTVFVVNEDEQSSNPFKVGDRVGILPAPPPGGPGQGGHGKGGHGKGQHGGRGEDGPGADGPGMDGPPPGGPGGPGGDGPREMLAGVISDYASAEARLEEMRKHREEKRGERGEGRGRHGEGQGQDDD